MASNKGRLFRMLSGVLLEQATIVEARHVGGFRRVRLRSEVSSFAAGTKIQILLPSDDARTYTPIPTPTGMTLLGWTHAGGPGARWMAELEAGQTFGFVGPQRSLQLAAGPVVLVGDETSVAVAAALAAERPGQVQAVLQSSELGDIPAAAASVGLERVEVVARGDTAATLARITSALAASPAAQLALTGSAALVVALREALRGAGMRKPATKPYWIAGRVGLD